MCSFAAREYTAALLLSSFSAMTPVGVPPAASSLSLRMSSLDHAVRRLRSWYFLGIDTSAIVREA